LADGLVHFAYNVAMPALLIVTIAQEPARNLLEWRFLLAFGGGSLLCFVLVFLAVRAGFGRDLASSAIYGMTASMTNTGFVALLILHSIYGQPAVLPAAVATVFVAAVMFPITVVLLESEGGGAAERLLFTERLPLPLLIVAPVSRTQARSTAEMSCSSAEG
jgi:malonate transporter and related proteins